MLNLIPTPKKCTVKDEALHAVPATVYTAEASFGEALATFAESLKRIYDIEMTATSDAGVSLVLDSTLAADSYVLDSTDKVIIRAATTEGAQYGLATALQLLEGKGDGLAVPSVVIEDRPDKDYRAFMIATGRIFHPFKKMLKYVDLCYYYKLKYLHLHFADADLYTMPSKAFPKLCKPGKHYTFEEIAKLNDYAASRGVVLVPGRIPRCLATLPTRHAPSPSVSRGLNSAPMASFAWGMSVALRR